ncbi:hypothetical protein GBA52_000414 [Prunus armeniaca]|nr:hypothetical protein GBA52_000414 [Prunus armeniaca]
MKTTMKNMMKMMMMMMMRRRRRRTTTTTTDDDEDDDEDGDDDHEPEIKFSGLYDDEAGPSLHSSDLNIEMRRMNMEES